MTYESTTTLARIRAANPCQDGWTRLLAYLGKTKADDEPLPLLTVLDSNGLDDALWVLSFAMPDDRLARHFQAWCAEQVLHIFEAERPNDTRVRNQIAMLRNDDAADSERAAARDAARAAARTAAWDAARDAAWAAARDAARAAARTAARDAARDAAWAAARTAAWTAAWDAARAAAWAAARAAQEHHLRKMIGGEE
jgi:hypothetical protein